MDFWKKRKVFITGGDGFVGGWLARTLADRGSRVVVLCRDERQDSSLHVLGLRGKVDEASGDLVNLPTLMRILNEYGIETCFHLGAQTLVQTANRSPLSTFESNIKGTWNILEACRQTPSVKRVIVASSDKAYGVQKRLPYTEDSPLAGLYPYDASKVCTDVLARSYFVSYKLPVTVTRNANTYGGGDMNFSRLIPDAIQCLLTDKRFEIRSDGTPQRDYIFVKDVVEAYMLLAENMHRRDVRGRAFNFGSGHPISVNELFGIMAKLCRKPNVRPKIMSEAANEIDRQYLSCARTSEILGWKPRYAIEEGLKETITWYKTYLKKTGSL